jgi:hypothetical protein
MADMYAEMLAGGALPVAFGGSEYAHAHANFPTAIKHWAGKPENGPQGRIGFVTKDCRSARYCPAVPVAGDAQRQNIGSDRSFRS